MKKVLSFLLAVMLLGSLLAIPVGAVDISISGTATGYDAYRIFDLSQAVKPGHDETGDCTAEGCDKAANPEGHWNYAYSFNEKYREAVMAGLRAVDVEGELDDRSVIKEIEQFDGELTRMFADALYGAVKDLDAEYSVDGSELKNVEPGYYLIAEKVDTGLGDSVSLVMLDTAGLEEVRVTTKEDVPTLEKKVYDDDTYEWVDSTTVGIGDEVEYSLGVLLPSSDVLSEYDAYKLVFHDDVSSGLEIIPDSIYCYYLAYGLRYPEPLGDGSDHGMAVCGYSFHPSQVLIRANGDSMLDNDCDLEIVIDDVKPLFPDIVRYASGEYYNGPNRIYVQYRCRITEDAKVGPGGNPNTAKLEFSNNPYHEGPTTETPEDKCTVFTFGLHVDKTDGKNFLSGAEFVLYNDDWLEPMVINPVEGSAGTQFEIKGLGAGKYKLVETKVPDGYQKCDEIEFEIIAECEEESDDPKLTKFEIVDMDGNSLLNGDEPMFMIDVGTGMITTTVANYSGVKLPSTGGTGVQGLYVVGALALAVGAAVVLSKRRKAV